MISDDFKSYFGSYAKISPLRLCKMKAAEDGPEIGYNGEIIEQPDVPYCNPDLFVEMDRQKHERVYRLLEEECALRGVECPRLFEDVKRTVGVAFNFPGLYAISLSSSELEVSSDAELRSLLAHEVKHLYQDIGSTPEEKRAAELDADRAAVESAGYEANLSFMMRIVESRIEQSSKLWVFKGLVQKLNEMYPRQFAEHYYFDRNENYPSMAQRLREMRRYEAQLNQESGPA